MREGGTAGSGTAGTGLRRLEALDGLRGLAILLVVVDHAVGTTAACAHCPGVSALPPILNIPTVFGGTVGVMLFFVLSGFLLFLPYAQAVLELSDEGVTSWPRTQGFYVRRMRRILPAYYPLLAVLVIGLWLVVTLQLHLPLARLPWGGYLAGVTLVYDLNRDLLATVAKSDIPLWSLTVEWQFYLVLPILALVLRRFARQGDVRRRARRLALGLVIVMALGIAVRGAAAWAHYGLGSADPAGGAPGALGVVFAILYGMKGKYLEVFATGMLASVFYVYMQLTQPRIPLSRYAGLAGWLAVGGIVACGAWALASGFLAADPQAWFWPVGVGTGWSAGWIWAVFGQWVTCVCSAILLLVALAPTRAWSWGRVFQFSPLRGLGIISYSLYLWHLPLLVVVFGPGPLSPLWAGERVVLGIIVAIAYASVSYRLIERPFQAPRRTSISVTRTEKGIPAEVESAELAAGKGR